MIKKILIVVGLFCFAFFVVLVLRFVDPENDVNLRTEKLNQTLTNPQNLSEIIYKVELGPVETSGAQNILITGKVLSYEFRGENLFMELETDSNGEVGRLMVDVGKPEYRISFADARVADFTYNARLVSELVSTEFANIGGKIVEIMVPYVTRPMPLECVKQCEVYFSTYEKYKEANVVFGKTKNSTNIIIGPVVQIQILK